MIFYKKSKIVIANSIALAMSMVFTSCDDSIREEYVEDAVTNYNVDMISVAKMKAIDFISGLGVVTRGSSPEEEISSCYEWTKENLCFQLKDYSDFKNLPDTIMYVVNLKNDNGYILVPVDQRIPGILAYIEHGSLSPLDRIENDGFKLFLDGVKKLLANRFPGENNNPIPGNDTMPWAIDTIYAPLLTTKWGQQYPFNVSCPTFNGNYSVAGCVAIATAQIIAYHESPESYNNHFFNWETIKLDSVPLYSMDIGSVAQLIADIGRIVHMNYTDTLSTANSIYVAECLDSLGYHHVGLVDYDYNTCMEEFNNSRPVYIKGRPHDRVVGHAWIIDGGIVRSVHLGMFLPGGGLGFSRTNIQRLVHCNWGMNGDKDGYFLSDVFDTEQGVDITRSYYDTNLQIYKEVYPLNQNN